MLLTGWVLLIAGGIGIIITAVFRSDWPMYASMVIATAGAAIVCWTRTRSRSRT